MKKIAVRDFQEKDMERILDFRDETARISFPSLKLDRERERASILSHMENHPGTVKVAVSEGKPIGYINFRPKIGSFGKYGFINMIFVKKDQRKHGVGAMLLQEAEKWCRSQGISSIGATVTNTNTRSLDFFKVHGFSEKRTVLEKKIR